MKCLIFFFLSISLFSCKRENIENTFSNDKVLSPLEFKNKELERLFIKSIEELDIVFFDEEFNHTILEFYDNPDGTNTMVVAIKNCPPIDVINLVFVKDYKGHIVYVYYGDYLKRKVSNFINTNDKPIKSVTLEPVSDEFECIYKREFILDSLFSPY